MSDNITLGKWGEDKAVEYLKSKKYKILERNFSCPRGEIDIIARFRGAIIFIEVKTRRNNACGWPEEAVTDKKKDKMKKTAEYFLEREKILNEKYYFDVISIIISQGNTLPEIKHFESI